MNWPLVSLLDVCSPKQWATISSRELTAAGFPVFGANGRIGFFGEFNHLEPVIVVGCRGSCGSMWLTPPKSYVTGNGMCLDNLRSDVLDRSFLFWFLTRRGFKDVTTGGSQPQITRANLRSVKVPVPAKREQRRIVELLDLADGLRQQRAEADAVSARILPALFHKMFGDPATNPKGWPIATLDQTTNITTGNTPSREDSENFGGEIPWARPADLEMALPLLNTAENISEKGSHVARMVPSGSVLVCCIGATLGKVGLAGSEMALNQQINALLPSAKATPEFLYTFCLLNARNFMAAATQATLPILNKSRFGQQPIYLPPLEVQCRFSELFQAVIKQHSEQAQARRDLENIFATMLHRAFTGELTAKWREAHMKELLVEMELQARQLRASANEN